ncbi:hypothetical protein FB45DRAFT_948383 [Roridomyces roridus]|uniref:Uncharacterized protein n=1 Tax=Roridomyces roridus TaxID=1738132 RepID=A0AAD7F9I5_9AGAR|nr:hypothetical protein FB45DRAFT_948383 [Roridomyces roridus]
MACAMNMPRCSPLLPPEMELEIFKTAARVHPETIPTLLRVAYRVLTRIEPLLYETLVISYPTLPSFRHVLETKPASFWSKNVRNLLITGNIDVSDAMLAFSVLSACTDVRNLGVYVPEDVLPYIIRPGAATDKGRLQRLHVDAQTPIDLRLPAFMGLTHLTVPDKFDLQEFVTELPALPSLTHLRFRRAAHRESLCAVLDGCENLEVLVMTDARSNWTVQRVGGALGIEDVRFVLMPVRVYELINDWEVETRGGWDLWARAEAFVDKKRRGEIQPRKLGFEFSFRVLLIVCAASRCWIVKSDGIP